MSGAQEPMRNLADKFLKSLVVGDAIGETSTLANPDIIVDLQKSMVEACLLDEECLLTTPS